MEFQDALDNGEAEPRIGRASRAALVAAIEAVEHLAQIRCRDAGTRVLDADPHVTLGTRNRTQHDVLSRRSESELLGNVLNQLGQLKRLRHEGGVNETGSNPMR